MLIPILRVMRWAPLLIAFALTAAACGTPAGAPAGDSTSSSPSTTTTTVAPVVETTTTSTTATTTTIGPPDPELEALLDELEAQWTPNCEASAQRHAQRLINALRDWDPTLVQGLGDFGGDLETLRAELTLNPSCPLAGYVVRFLVQVDETKPAGKPNLLLGASPFVESSLLYIRQQHGAAVAARLAPDVDPDAPPPPVVPDESPKSCAELRTELGEYYRGLVEAANSLTPIEGFEVVDKVLTTGGSGFVIPECPYDTLLAEILIGLSEAEATSFMATVLRWSAIGQLRGLLRPALIGSGDLQVMRDEVAENVVLILTNISSSDVADISVEVWTSPNGDGFHMWTRPGDFVWRSEFLGPGEEVRVDTEVPVGDQLEWLISWVEDNGVTRRYDGPIAVLPEPESGDPAP